MAPNWDVNDNQESDGAMASRGAVTRVFISDVNFFLLLKGVEIHWLCDSIS